MSAYKGLIFGNFSLVYTYSFLVIIYIYTQYIIVNNYKDKNGSLKLIKFLSFSFFLSFFLSFFFFGGGG